MAELRGDIPETPEREPKPLRYIWLDANNDPVISWHPQPEHLWRGGQGQTRPSMPLGGR